MMLKRLLLVTAASLGVLTAAAAIPQTAMASQVSFETFVSSVKGGEFVLSPKVNKTFLEALGNGDTDKAMEIYRDYFDGDATDGIAYVVATPAESTDGHASEDEDEADQVKAESEETEAAEAVSSEAEEADDEADEAQADDADAQTIEADDPRPEEAAPEQPAPVAETAAPAAGDRKFNISEDEYNALCKIVYAEAHTQGEEGMLLIANVILNRVNNFAFPSTVMGVISQPGQFAPVRNGRYAAAIPTPAAVRAVDRALSGENHVGAALYFKSSASAQSWGHRTLVLSYGNHSFYY